ERHQVALCLDVRAAQHGAVGRHYEGFLVDHVQQCIEGVLAAAYPGTGVPVENRITFRRHHVTHSDHVGAPKAHPDITAGMRLDEVAVVDVLVGQCQLALVTEGRG